MGSPAKPRRSLWRRLQEGLQRLLIGRLKRPVLFLLDEFPVLGHMEAIENAVGLARGFGIQLWFFLQDLSQLKNNYGSRWSSFFANAGVHQFFTPADMETARFISERCGSFTTRAHNITSTDRFLEPEVKRDLASVHELMGMPPYRQLLFISGKSHALLANKQPYFQSLLYQGRASRNPYV